MKVRVRQFDGKDIWVELPACPSGEPSLTGILARGVRSMEKNLKEINPIRNYLTEEQKMPNMRSTNSRPCPLFYYSVVYFPKQKRDAEEKSEPKILIEPTLVVAEDEAQVRFKATRKIPAEYENKIDQIEIYVRPFAE